MDIDEILKYIGELYVQSKAEVSSLRAEIVRLQGIIEDMNSGKSGLSAVPPNERESAGEL